MKKISELTIDEALKEFLYELNDMFIFKKFRGHNNKDIKVRLDCVMVRLEQILFRTKKG